MNFQLLDSALLMIDIKEYADIVKPKTFERRNPAMVPFDSTWEKLSNETFNLRVEKDFNFLGY